MTLSPKEMVFGPSDYEIGDWVVTDFVPDVRQVIGKVIDDGLIRYALSNPSEDDLRCRYNSFDAVTVANDHSKAGLWSKNNINKKVPLDISIIDPFYSKGKPVQFENEVWIVANYGWESSQDHTLRFISLSRYHEGKKIYKDIYPEQFNQIIFLYDFDPDKDQLFKNKNKEINMAKDQVKDKPSTMDMFKRDAEKAGYRVGARRISQASKDAIVSLLQSHKMKKSQINAVVELLDTELGHAAVSLALGMLLPKIPTLGEDPRVQKLCEEFRIEGMAIAGEELLDVVLDRLSPVLKDVIRALPTEKPKVRVEADGKTTKVLPLEVDLEPEVEEKVEKKAKVIPLSSAEKA